MAVLEDIKKNLRRMFILILGNIRLTLSQMAVSKVGDGGKSTAPVSSRHFVFVVENAIDAVYADLTKRGVKFKSRRILRGLFREGHLVFRS